MWFLNVKKYKVKVNVLSLEHNFEKIGASQRRPCSPAEWQPGIVLITQKALA